MRTDNADGAEGTIDYCSVQASIKNKFIIIEAKESTVVIDTLHS